MTDRHVVVTGASGGIGSAIVNVITAHGFIVHGLDIGDSPDLPASEGSYFHYSVDVTDQRNLSECFTTISKRTDSIHAIVHCAGKFEHTALAEIDGTVYRKIVDLNVLSAGYINALFLPLLIKPAGRIVHLSSETSLATLPFQLYGLTKRMLEEYIDVVRQELAFLGVYVISIKPGAHRTKMLAESYDRLGAANSTYFSRQLEIVRQKGQAILEKEKGASPVDIAYTVRDALQAQRPKRSYSVNISWRFRIISLLPVRLKEMVLRMTLK